MTSRLVAGTVLALSLLAIVPAPTYRLWQGSVLITELGHGLAVASLAVAWLVRRRRGLALAWIAAALALGSPLARGWLFAREAGFDLHLAGLVVPPGSGCTGAEYRYARVGSWDGRLDLYRPPGAGSVGERGPARAPVVVIVHGGSWSSGGRGEFLAFTCELAGAGFAVADVDYRLAPTHPYPAPADDVAEAVEFLRREQSTLGVDATRVVLLGRSAGGHLALDVGYREALADVVRGVVALYAPADLAYGYAHPAMPWVMDSQKTLRDFIGGAPSERAEAYRTASPYEQVGDRTPATLLVHGTRDELVRVAQSRRLSTRLAQHARPHRFLELPWATHACDVVTVGPCAAIVRQAVLRFVRASFDAPRS